MGATLLLRRNGDCGTAGMGATLLLRLKGDCLNGECVLLGVLGDRGDSGARVAPATSTGWSCILIFESLLCE